jgi:soluble lytic murein transglycosylase
MNQKEIENTVEKVFDSFINEWKIDDYPRLFDVFAIISTESSWNPKAESPYARGLMQISKSALETINKLYKTQFTYDDMFNVEANAWIGIRYLRWLYKAFSGYENRIILTVMAYNWGIKNVTKWLMLEKACNSLIDEAVPDETKNYILDYIFWCNWYKSKIRM